MPAVEIENLSKTYRTKKVRIEALKQINLRIDENQIFGLLGPNGAGKTTTINILSTLLTPTSGRATVLGFNVANQEKEIRKRVGVCYGASRFYWNFDVYENLNFYGMLYGMNKEKRKKKIDELVERLNMKSFSKLRISDMSTGMRQKVVIAKSLINDPELIFLDEPTIGLDVEVAREVRKYMKELVKEKGVTILLTSHNMHEIEIMCENIALINKGRIIREGKPNEIKSRLNFPDRIFLQLSSYKDLEFIKNLAGFKSMRMKGDGLIVDFESAEEIISKLMEEIKSRNIKVLDLEIRKADLEEAFLKIVGDSNV
jgi:ABC-2 type transport system ATP-binding protein